MKVLNKPRGDGHWNSVYLPLQENLGWEAREGVLTGAEHGSAVALALRQTSGSKRKKSLELGSPAAQEWHNHEEHGGGVHR
jgi:hypothetical protein